MVERCVFPFEMVPFQVTFVHFRGRIHFIQILFFEFKETFPFGPPGFKLKIVANCRWQQPQDKVCCRNTLVLRSKVF